MQRPSDERGPALASVLGVRARRARAALALATTLLALGCDEGRTDEDSILDLVVISADRVFEAIDEPSSTWLVTVDEGSEVNGTLENGLGGNLKVVGWRTGAEHVAEHGFHGAFSEKIFLSFSNWSEEGTLLNGAVTVTRHSHDFGPPDGAIEDASRTTVYQGALSTTGAIGGTFEIDVHAMASRKVLWTCGTINDREMGHGACF